MTFGYDELLFGGLPWKKLPLEGAEILMGRPNVMLETSPHSGLIDKKGKITCRVSFGENFGVLLFLFFVDVESF